MIATPVIEAKVKITPNGKKLRAYARITWVLFRESQNSLVSFLIILLGGALVFRSFYQFPNGSHPSFVKALHVTFTLIFFETNLAFPEGQWYLQILFFAIPILGLLVAVDGVIRFGTALFNKNINAQEWQIAMASTYSNHVIICGMGKVGYRTTLELLKFGREIVAIDTDPHGRFIDKIQALGIPVIIANARRSENLLKAGAERADVVIACTDDELTNLDIALDAREINPQAKIVMRMFDPDLAQRVEKGFGIHTALSTSALAAPVFASSAMRVNNVKYSFYLGHELLNLSEFIISANSRLIGWSLAQLTQQVNISVISYQDTGIADLNPDPTICLMSGSKLLVLGSIQMLQQLDGLNSPVR